MGIFEIFAQKLQHKQRFVEIHLKRKTCANNNDNNYSNLSKFTGIGIFDNSFPIEFVIKFHKLTEPFGFGGIVRRRFRTEGVRPCNTTSYNKEKLYFSKINNFQVFFQYTFCLASEFDRRTVWQRRSFAIFAVSSGLVSNSSSSTSALLISLCVRCMPPLKHKKSR